MHRKAPLVFCIFCLCMTSLYAQNRLTRVMGPEDEGVLWPVPDTSLSRRDAGALQELLDYCKAVGSELWTTMHASGTISYGINGSYSGNAEIDIKGAEMSRLSQSNAQKPTIATTAFRGGKAIYASGKQSSLVPEQAQLGLIDFPRLLLLNSTNSQLWSLVDGGLVTVSQSSGPAHKVTLSFPLYASRSDPPTGIGAIDYYFDPSSHLLIKSVALIEPRPGTGEEYLRQTSYDDYRAVNNRLLPFRYSQTFGGQRGWNLSLTAVATDVDVPDSLFF